MSAMLRESALLKQLKDMAETHAIELRAYEATVANLEQRIAQMEQERVPEGWIPVSERLPEPGKVVMAYYKNSVGGDRIICGFHAPKHKLEADCHDDESCFDFDESTNTDYMAEGWLERLDNWGEYQSIYVVEGEVTHWMPQPTIPQQKKEGE